MITRQELVGSHNIRSAVSVAVVSVSGPEFNTAAIYPVVFMFTSISATVKYTIIKYPQAKYAKAGTMRYCSVRKP